MKISRFESNFSIAKKLQFYAVFQSLARDKAIDKTIEHASRMGMYRDVAMRQACLSKKTYFMSHI